MGRIAAGTEGEQTKETTNIKSTSRAFVPQESWIREAVIFRLRVERVNCLHSIESKA